MFNVLNHLIYKITISIYEKCNLKCGFCPMSYGYGDSSCMMTIDMFSKIIKQLDGFEGYVSITSRGESVLHPQFKEFVDILHHKKRTYKTIIYHNSTMLDKFENVLLMFDVLSLDCYSNDTEYNKLKTRYCNNKKVEIIDNFSKHGRLSTFTNRGGFFNKDNIIYSGKCTLPFTRIVIDWKGDYILCCHDWLYNKPISNINTMSIPEYYKYINKLEHISALRKGIRSDSPCCFCDYKEETSNYYED